MTIISFDPGLTGGHAVFGNGKLMYAGIMPIKKIETKPKRMVQDLKDGKKQYVKSGPNKGNLKMKMKSAAKYKTELDTIQVHALMQNQDFIVIEQQNPRPGNSAASSASTMKNFGKLLACAELSDAQLILVTPGVWKKHYGLSLTPKEKKLLTNTEYKQMSIQKAYDITEWNTSYDGIADAICIGSWFFEKRKADDKI